MKRAFGKYSGLLSWNRMGLMPMCFWVWGLNIQAEQMRPFRFLKKPYADPHTPGWYMHILATAYRDIQNYEEAMKWGEKAVHQNPKNVLSRVILCSIYSLAGRMDEARVQAEEIMRINSKFSVDQLAKTDPQKNKDVKKRYIDALRKAGLK